MGWYQRRVHGDNLKQTHKQNQCTKTSPPASLLLLQSHRPPLQCNSRVLISIFFQKRQRDKLIRYLPKPIITTNLFTWTTPFSTRSQLKPSRQMATHLVRSTISSFSWLRKP